MDLYKGTKEIEIKLFNLFKLENHSNAWKSYINRGNLNKTKSKKPILFSQIFNFKNILNRNTGSVWKKITKFLALVSSIDE